MRRTRLSAVRPVSRLSRYVVRLCAAVPAGASCPYEEPLPGEAPVCDAAPNSGPAPAGSRQVNVEGTTYSIVQGDLLVDDDAKAERHKDPTAWHRSYQRR